MNFFITGLPRSRTMWFSEYYAKYGRTCFHELSTRIESVEDYQQQLGDNNGNSDWNLINTETFKLYPNAPVVVVLRDPEEVTRSFQRVAGWPYAMTYVTWDYHYQRLASLNAPNVMHVDYEEIDLHIEDLHRWLTPNLPFDEQTAEEMAVTKVHEGFDSYHPDLLERSINVWRQL